MRHRRRAPQPLAPAHHRHVGPGAAAQGHGPRADRDLGQLRHHRVPEPAVPGRQGLRLRRRPRHTTTGCTSTAATRPSGSRAWPACPCRIRAEAAVELRRLRHGARLRGRGHFGPLRRAQTSTIPTSDPFLRHRRGVGRPGVRPRGLGPGRRPPPTASTTRCSCMPPPIPSSR